jgi:hypothetical protein
LPRPPESRAQKIGIALHAKAEHFIKTGHLDYSSFAEEEKEAARLLPAISPYLPAAAQSEQKVKVEIGGVQFSGRYDWFRLNADGNSGEVGDLKTTSSLRWVKSALELSTHPQPLIYASALLTVPKENVTCRWVYVQTRGAPYVKEVFFKPDFSAMPDIIRDGQNIVRAWEDKGDPNSYEPTPSACDAYGGCPYRSQCRLDAGARLLTLLGKSAAPAASEDKMTNSAFDDLIAALKNVPQQPKAESEDLHVVTVSQEDPLPSVLALAEEEKPKRKRRTKAEREAAMANLGFGGLREPTTDRAPPMVAMTQELEEVEASLATNSKPIGTLYVSCQPSDSFEHGEYIFAAANAEVSEAFGLTDYRQAEFAKATGHFVAAVVSKVKDMRPESLYVDTRWAETSACLATLMSMSERIVRAL